MNIIKQSMKFSTKRAPTITGPQFIPTRASIYALFETDGLNKEDINLKCAGDALFIRCEPAKYARSIPLPHNVLPPRTTARFQDGVLSIKLKKSSYTVDVPVFENGRELGVPNEPFGKYQDLDAMRDV
jgi:HSP20-like domain found in ArsA